MPDVNFPVYNVVRDYFKTVVYGRPFPFGNYHVSLHEKIQALMSPMQQVDSVPWTGDVRVRDRLLNDVMATCMQVLYSDDDVGRIVYGEEFVQMNMYFNGHHNYVQYYIGENFTSVMRCADDQIYHEYPIRMNEHELVHFIHNIHTLMEIVYLWDNQPD